MSVSACECAHDLSMHATGDPRGPCLVELPPFVEEELPAWRCPCRKYAPAATAGPWRWHASTQSWALPREPAA